MSKYIDAEKLKITIGNYEEGAHAALNPNDGDADYYKGKIDACKDIQDSITALQQEQPDGIEGVVHHFHMAHYIVTNQEQLTARLRQFPSEAEVKIFIYARKEDTK